LAHSNHINNLNSLRRKIPNNKVPNAIGASGHENNFFLPVITVTCPVVYYFATESIVQDAEGTPWEKNLEGRRTGFETIEDILGGGREKRAKRFKDFRAF